MNNESKLGLGTLRRALTGGMRGSVVMIFVACGFAALWGWDGFCALGVPSRTAAVAAISISVLAAASVVRCFGHPEARPRPVDARWMWIAIIGEAVCIPIAANITIDLGRPDLGLCAVACVVGLHFLPMARALAYTPYRWIGAAIFTIALLAMTMSEPARSAFLGCGVASILWGSIGAKGLTGGWQRTARRNLRAGT